MDRPRIAVTVGSEGAAKGYGNYLKRVAEAGAEAVIAEPGTPPCALLDSVDALLVTGGTDIDPAQYGEAAVPELLPIDSARDEAELGLVSAALERNLPILAICRGFQVLNVARGGRLLQHIAGDAHRASLESPHDSRVHSVQVKPDSLLAAIIGEGTHTVNSRHHQAVLPDMLGSGLLATAASPDGVVEAIESPNHRFVLGVQWHPERPESIDGFRSLFAALIAAAHEPAAVTP